MRGTDVTVSGNSFPDGGPNQGSGNCLQFAGGATTITAVTIEGNQFVNSKLTAVQFAGSGSETGIVVENNTDYSTAQFCASSNTNATVTEAGNQVLVPSTYATPLLPSGGGWQFLRMLKERSIYQLQ